MSIKLTIPEILHFKKTIFSHLQKLTTNTINHSTLLISYTDDHLEAYQKITTLPINKSDIPKLISLKESCTLINPSDAILKHQRSINFVTMRYILKMIDSLKFVFAFDACETKQKPIQNIKEMIIRFLSLFKKDLSKDELNALAKSCSLLILNTDPNHTIKTYKERIVGSNFTEGLLEQGYISQLYYEGIKVIFENIFQQQRVLLSSKKQQKGVKDQFISMNSRCQFFQVGGKMNDELSSNYLEYASQRPQICKEWSELFKLILDNLDAVVMFQGVALQKKQLHQQVKNKGEAIKKYGISLIERIVQQFIPKFEAKQLKIKYKHRFQRLLLLVSEIFKMFDSQRDMARQLTYQQTQAMVILFVSTLERGGFISPIVKYYFEQYFNIYRFLSLHNNSDTDLFQRIFFFETVDNMYEKMRIILNHLIETLEEQFQQISLDFDFKLSLQQFNTIISIGQKKVYNFYSPIINKKLKKLRFNLLHKSLSFISKSKPKQLISTHILLLQYSVDISMIQNSLLVQICKDLCQQLQAFQPSFTHLIIHIYNLLPEYEIYDKVISLYEQKLNLNPDLFPYLDPLERLEMINEHFSDYCTFLMKIGLQQKVRQLCLEAFKRFKSAEEREVVKSVFENAKGNYFQELHNSFIQQSILQEREVIIVGDLVFRVKQACIKEGIFNQLQYSDLSCIAN